MEGEHSNDYIANWIAQAVAFNGNENILVIAGFGCPKPKTGFTRVAECSQVRPVQLSTVNPITTSDPAQPTIIFHIARVRARSNLLAT